MQLSNSSIDKSIEPPIDTSTDRLLFILSVLAILLLQPYFIWAHLAAIYRISHITGIAIILYIIIQRHNYDVYHIGLSLFFVLVSVYSMIGGTENHKLSYFPLLILFFIALKPNEQLRVFDYFVTILAVFYSIGLVSYLLSILGLNIQFGTAEAPNSLKSPYLVFFGHVEETGLPVYRFCDVFDEAGVVGTVNGLILSSIGISTRDIRSIVLLLAGLVSFSLAFYVILIFILLFKLDFKKIFLGLLIIVSFAILSGDKFNELITSRLAIENGHLSGDNRSHPAFDEWYNSFLAKGGKDLIFGRGSGSFLNVERGAEVSSYKSLIVDQGIIGVALILSFYFLCVCFINNSKEGWFLCLIFILSAFQRPNFTSYYIIVMFFGGLNYLKNLREQKFNGLVA
jgi:hypothetical protein